jgi:hypothetical protein
MAKPTRILICSDIHYACDLEKARENYETKGIANPLQRAIVSSYRRYFWLRDPFAHNDLLSHVLAPPFEPDLVVANGDYSCDSAFIGVSDPAAQESARECLGKLRERFPGKLLATYGDHELGKMSLCGGHGGLRLQSLEVAQRELQLEPLWTRRIGRYVLIGVTSSLIAMPVYERETLPSERPAWWELRRQHLHGIEAVFNALGGDERLILFCHDPTALPYLWELESIRRKEPQIERTVIGHLHGSLILKQSRILSGMPKIVFCGQAIRRMSSALSRGKDWRHFRVLLCPSLAGLQITKRGGFYSAEVDPEGKIPARFELHPVRWN